MEFINLDPSATVRAANIRATLDALAMAPKVSEQLVANHGLDPHVLRADNFVPVQRWLNALKEIQAQAGEPALRESGMRIVQNAEFPPQYPTVEDILLNLNDIYYVNHRGDVGHYDTQQKADGSVVVRCATPYPRNFERGLVEGICRNRRAGNTIYCVEYNDVAAVAGYTCELVVHRAG